jgi:hypothetical protein
VKTDKDSNTTDDQYAGQCPPIIPPPHSFAVSFETGIRTVPQRWFIFLDLDEEVEIKGYENGERG